MTKEELAARLNGREYGSEITDAEEAAAKADGLVVVFGYSDDNAEFRGAINAEIGCFSGGTFLLVNGALFDDSDACECGHALAARAQAARLGRKIEAVMGASDDYTWTYETDIPHATFEVMDEGEKFCRGIVFALADAKGRAS